MVILFLVILLMILLGVSGFFSSAETVLFSLSSMKVKGFKHDQDPKKQLVAKLLASPKDLLVTIIMINVAVNILIQNVASSLFGDETKWLLNVGVPLALTLILGEFIPK